MTSNAKNKPIKMALKFFHLLPDGAKLFLRSFKQQESELYELGWLVEKSSIAIDIGANKGSYTYVLSRLVGKHGKVVAVEPIKELAVYLKHACRQLKLPVEIEQCCLSSKNGTGKLIIPSTSNGELLTGLSSLEEHYDNVNETREVKLKRLDDLLNGRKQRVSFIKCDVEGHELEVFQGGLGILKADRPNLLVEIEQRHIKGSIYDHLNFFVTQNYKGYFLDTDKKLKALNEFDVAIHQSHEYNGISSNNYVYNFIFLPAEAPDADILRKRLK